MTEQWFYISFADDVRFFGATTVMASSPEDALGKATAMGLNPGGEAAILEVPEEAWGEPDFIAMKNRLVRRDEMMTNGGARLADLPADAQEAINDAATKVCGDCNPCP